MIKYVYAILFIAAASVAALDTPVKSPAKRTYVCPPNFIRLSHKCYFFSKKKATWNEAYFQCTSMRSNLAIVKNANQDRLIRQTLNRKKLKPLERWIGGRFDWQQKEWKWAASGKPVLFNGFDSSLNQTKEDLQWNCITIDPEFDYRWNFKSCFQEKHFICHKKIQTITNNRSRKKLLQKYSTLNEVPIPDVSNDLTTNSSSLKGLQKILPARSVSSLFEIEVNTNLDPNFNTKPKRKQRRNKKKKAKNPVPLLTQFPNGTVYESNGQENYRRRRNKAKEEVPQFPMKIYYQSYKESSHSNDPLRPKPIVEEYNFAKTP